MEPSTNATPDGRRIRRKPAYVADDPLLDARESAIETGRGLSTFWRDVAAGRLPPPYHVTKRCRRWRRSELRASVEASRAPAKSAP
jgi:predicted DNA-binding transcriptional regulator AlpA